MVFCKHCGEFVEPIYGDECPNCGETLPDVEWEEDEEDMEDTDFEEELDDDLDDEYEDAYYEE